MLETKLALDQELARLEQLSVRMREMAGLADDERELLEELVRGHVESTRQAWVDERLEKVVDLLYPSHDRRGRSEAEKPVRWPDHDWWWNGASIKSRTERHDGDFIIDLSSYVGGGETDTIEGFIIPKAWVYADDIITVIRGACITERARREGVKRAQDLAQAQWDAVAAAARLAQLQGASNG